MPPKTQEIEMPWTIVKEVCTPAEMERLACLGVALLNAGNVDKSIYQSAADSFGVDIKPESYKRSIWVVSTKIKKVLSDGVSSVTPSPGKGNKKPGSGKGRKRKTNLDEEDGDEEVDGDDESPAKRKKGRKTFDDVMNEFENSWSGQEEAEKGWD